MSVHLTPYLAFTGNAREAMAFYQDVFGGDLNSNTFAEFGESDPAFADQIMHAQLDTPGGMVLMASDVPPGMEHVPGRSVTLILHGDDEQVMRGYWDRLVEEGTAETALEAQMWGDIYGQCVDKYGVVWMMNISAPQ